MTGTSAQVEDTTGVDRDGEPAPGTEGTITISLRIENMYEDSDYDATTYAIDRVIPAPPCGPDADPVEFHEWAQEHVMQFTGTGHSAGDSWYDAEVIACSERGLLGHTFEFGY